MSASDSGWIDISLPIGPDLLVWPGNPAVEIRPVQRMADGDGADVSELRLGTHTGTHVDPPRHMIEGASGVDRVPLDVLMGPCWVADATGRRGALGADDLDSLQVPAGADRLLVRTDNSDLWQTPSPAFPESYVSVSEDGARWIVSHEIGLVGVDFLGIEARDTRGHPTHVELLSNGVVIVEGLNLDGVGEGSYDLVVMPLHIVDGDGGPARAALRWRG
jgi:arylformamidase